MNRGSLLGVMIGSGAIGIAALIFTEFNSGLVVWTIFGISAVLAVGSGFVLIAKENEF